MPAWSAKRHLLLERWQSAAGRCCPARAGSGKPPRLPNVSANTSGPEAGAAHAEQQDVGEPACLHLVLERLQRGDVGPVVHDVSQASHLPSSLPVQTEGLASPQSRAACRSRATPRGSGPRPPCFISSGRLDVTLASVSPSMAVRLAATAPSRSSAALANCFTPSSTSVVRHLVRSRPRRSAVTQDFAGVLHILQSARPWRGRGRGTRPSSPAAWC